MSKQTFSDPFAQVDIQPISVAGETLPTRIAVRVKDDVGDWHVQGVLGRDYQLLPNRKVRDLAEDIMSRTGSELGGFNNLKTLYDGKRYVDYFASRNPITRVNGTRNPLELHLGLMVWNAYDGSRKVGFEIFALNPCCTNQYHSRNRLGYFAWRHTPGAAGSVDMDEALTGISAGASNLIRVAPAIQCLRQKPLSLGFLKEAKTATDLPQSKWGDVIDALGKEEDTHFGLFQAMTSVTSHKMSGFSAIQTGTNVVEWFLQSGGVPNVMNHTDAETVIGSRT